MAIPCIRTTAWTAEWGISKHLDWRAEGSWVFLAPATKLRRGKRHGVIYCGPYGDACQYARQWARTHDYKTIYLQP